MTMSSIPSVAGGFKNTVPMAPAFRTQYCVVCGQGSSRTDWINKSGDSVACDFHTPAQMQAAIAAKTPKAVAPVKLGGVIGETPAAKPTMSTVVKK